MSVLCGRYWHPVHAFIRGHGVGREEAEDVTQGFFASLLSRGDLAAVQPDRGRFRGWLRASARHYLLNHLDHARSLKMGGAVRFVSLEGEPRAVTALPAEGALGPDRLFDRLWALAVVERSLDRLREEYAREGRGDVFARLRSTLTGEEGQDGEDGENGENGEGGHVEPAGPLPGAVRARRNREKVEMRGRYRRCLRAEVGATVADPAAVVDELRELLDALG